MGWTWDDMYDKLEIQYGGLPGKSTQDMLNEFWIDSGFPGGVPGNDERQTFYEGRGAVGDSLGDIENDFWNRIGPDILVGLGAVFAIDASDSVEGEQVAVNKGSGGSALNAQYGSTTGVDTNDPLLLPHTGVNYFMSPETSRNMTVPHQADFNSTGDIVMSVRLYNQNRVTGDTQLIGRAGHAMFIANTGGTLSPYMWDAGSGGAIRFPGFGSGGTGALPDGFTGWLEWRVNGTTGVGSYWSAPDSETYPTTGWTLVNSHGAPGSWVGPLASATVTMTIGSKSSTTASANVHTSGGRYSTDGVERLFFTLSSLDGDELSFVASTGQTVTVNRITSGIKGTVVTRPVWVFGSDDYLEVPDNSLLDPAGGDSLSVVVVGRAWNTQSANAAIVAKKANITDTTSGWLMANGATALQVQGDVGDGAAGTTATSSARVSGALSVWAMVRDVNADTLTTYVNATGGTPVADATTTTLANSEVMRIGRLSGAGAGYNEMEVFAVAVFRTALTADQIQLIMNYYGVV